MAATKIIWVIINCNNKKEADSIGQGLLKQRLIGCFDVIPEREAAYFWPPKSGKVEKIKGSMLIGVTMPNKYEAIVRVAKKMHSDKVPFIGSLTFNKVNLDYSKWLIGELS